MNWASESRAAAMAAGIDPDLFERQMRHESANYDPNVIAGRRSSSAGAQGIAQFMPSTARGLGVDPLNPRQALRGAARLMASYVKKYGSYHDALVAYNAGPARVGGNLPAETVKYLQIILGDKSPGIGAGKKYLAQTSVPGPVKQVSGGTSTDTEGAIIDTLLQHHHGSMLKDVVSKLDSGQYTSSNPTRMVSAGPGMSVAAGGEMPANVSSIINRANIIGGQHRKYLLGGGHGAASLNDPQPLDCSGAVALALGIKPRTSGQFNTIGQPGKGLVNLYFTSGHIFMSVMRGGKEMFWGTSGFGHPGSGTGAGWFTVQPGAKYLAGFQVRHVA